MHSAKDTKEEKMIIPDIIITWPKNCDYPLWRQYIRENRSRFNEIIVVFMEPNQGPDYSSFVKEAMFQDHVLFIDSVPIGPGEDWRDKAIHSALLHSYNAPWILFTEQDFLPTDAEIFWKYIQETIDFERADAIGVIDGTRIHPCFLLMRRGALNRTRKQFGIVPDKLDHFGLIQEDIQNEHNDISLYVLPLKLENGHILYSHMNGLSHNMTLLQNGAEITYKPEEFQSYLRACMEASVIVQKRFYQVITHYLSLVDTNSNKTRNLSPTPPEETPLQVRK